MSTAGSDSQGGAAAGAGAEGEAAEPADVVGLRKALTAAREAKKAAETERDTLKGTQAERERKAAEDAGKHRELYEGLKPKFEAAEAKVAAYEAKETARIEALTTRNTARIAALPEDFRDLVPDGLDPDATTAHIEKLEARAHKADPKFAKGGGAAGANKGAPSIPEDCKREALANNKPEQWWFDNVWNSPQAVARRARSKT